MARAVQFDEFGSTDVLHVAEVPELTAGPGQVRLAVRAAGVNPVEWKVLHGYMGPRPLPSGLGNDVAGVVDQVGEGVTTLAVGDEVLGTSSTPSYATSALAEADALVAKPASVSWEVAGGLAGAGGTAVTVLERLAVGAGDTLLIHAAAGGVGIFAVQLAIARGARVIGTASERNHELLRSLGATPVLYGDGLAERVRALSPDGVDAVLDASGRGELPVSVELAGGPERVLTIASFADNPDGVTVHMGGGGDTPRALAEILALIDAGRLEVPIWRTYALDEAAAALTDSETGHLNGKLVLLPS